MAVITMSRQIGSGADEVANGLCEVLGLQLFEKGLIQQVASELGLGATEMVDYSEDDYKRATFLDALFRRSRRVEEVLSTWHADEQPGIEATRVLDEELAVDLTRTAIEAACECGNVLIVGRGSQIVLEDRPGVLHLRLVAPIEQRLERLMKGQKMTPAQARRFVTQRDSATEEYLRRFYQADVNDPSLYHMVLNTGKLGIRGCVKVIEAAVEHLG